MMKPLRFFIMALLCAVANVAWGETWIKTDISQLQGNDIIVIVDVTSKLAMPNNNGTSAAPTATEVTLSEDKSKITSTIDGTLQWRFIKNQNNFQFQVPTSTNILNINSPIYFQTCVTAAAFASTTGGELANNEKIIQERTIIAPSKQTAQYDLRKLFPTFCVGSPAKVESGIGAIAV